MRLKAEHGAVEIKGLGIRLTQNSTPEQLAAALKAAPQLAQFIEGSKPNKDVKK